MRRVLNGLVVLCLAAVLTTPAQAAPRRDDSGDRLLPAPIQRVVQLIKKLIKPLDDTNINVSWPRP